MFIRLKKWLLADKEIYVQPFILSICVNGAWHQHRVRHSLMRLPLLALIISLAIMMSLIAGCSENQTELSQQTIPTDSNQWQKKLGATLEQLPEPDQQLLSRYMLRMKLSDAYESGAIPRTTIKQALVQQLEYERMHPNNPTGKKSPVGINHQAGKLQAQNYPIALLPVKTSTNDRLNKVKLQFILSNEGTVAIDSFQGILIMQDDKLPKGRLFNIPLTHFEPAIAADHSSMIVIETSIEDINVMRAIKNAQDVTITIDKGVMKLSNGQKIVFTPQPIDVK